MHTSPWPKLNIPKCNILSYLYPNGGKISKKPIWKDAQDPRHSLSAAEMLSMIKRFATGLNSLCVKPQQVVMTFTPNHIYVPLVYLATAGSKRCFTGVSPAYTRSEVAYQMKAVEPAIVMIHESLLETGKSAAADAGIPISRLYVFSDSREVPATPGGVQDWRNILASDPDSEDWCWDPLSGEVATTTVAVINFSSGTTGLPKGVCITHHNLVANAAQAIYVRYQAIPDAIKHQEAEQWLAFLPLYHAYSQLFTINIALKLEVTVYVMKKFSFETLLQCVQQYKISTIHAVPPLLVMLAKRAEVTKYDLSSLKYILSGGAPLGKDLQIEVMKRFNLVVAQGFGMSETTCSAFLIPGTTADSTGSIGNLMPNTEACLINEQDEIITNEGTPGELCLRGPQMMLGYWKNKEATKQTIDSSRWMRTGDVAVTRSGKWWIVDRRKELIKGLQVAPAELEAVLLDNDTIADAAAVGITIRGEELPRAYVVLQPASVGVVTEKSVQDFVAQKVAKHKRLAGGVKFVEAVPKLASGKIVRKLIKEWAREDAERLRVASSARL